MKRPVQIFGFTFDALLLLCSLPFLFLFKNKRRRAVKRHAFTLSLSHTHTPTHTQTHTHTHTLFSTCRGNENVKWPIVKSQSKATTLFRVVHGANFSGGTTNFFWGATLFLWYSYFFYIHLGYSFSFTVVYLCQIIGGIPSPSGGIVGKNRSKTTVRSKRVGPLGSRWGPFSWLPQWYLLFLFFIKRSSFILVQ